MANGVKSQAVNTRLPKQARTVWSSLASNGFFSLGMAFTALYRGQSRHIKGMTEFFIGCFKCYDRWATGGLR
ncbi:hypothetical protein DFH07DRAFT_956814 [Mycena maculata]|uniref:Uncharacterized protein n=1 Tax=Mycena maculata TaxID=230809 RepID=A0AAD7JGW0_9AGAR|nr:hypothetical protein DFH07DRAFT_956814 [Mycena maculata]